MDFDSPCDVIGTTIQPVLLAASAQPFRGGLKETNIIPMMTIDLKTAFPTSSSSSAFKPLAAASNHVTKVIIIVSLFSFCHFFQLSKETQEGIYTDL
jgi:hypothetical protein